MSDVAPNYDGHHNKEELAFEELASSYAAAIGDYVALMDDDDEVGRVALPEGESEALSSITF